MVSLLTLDFTAATQAALVINMVGRGRINVLFLFTDNSPPGSFAVLGTGADCSYSTPSLLPDALISVWN